MTKRILSVALALILALSIVPITAYAGSGDIVDTSADADLADVACLDRDAPHGESIWAAIAALEAERLPEGAGPDDYAALYDEVEAIVTSSQEYVEGSLVYAGDTVYWDTPDGMGHGWSPYMRSELNGWSDDDTIPQSADADSEDTVNVGECLDPPAVEATDDEPFIGTAADVNGSPDIDAAGASPRPANDADLVATGEGSTTAKDIALIAPYQGYSGDIWEDETTLLTNLSNTTGGTFSVYNNTSATINVIADALESCAVVIVYTHGMVDRCGTMYDTRVSNSSYICLTTGAGLTARDTEWITGSFGLYRHAYSVGTSSQSNNREVFAVDGTAIANHMDKQAPNNLLWMNSCLTMATDGLCKPLMDRGVGVVFGYSKPASAYGGKIYTDFFFESLMDGSTVSAAASYMKKQANCDWDPIFKEMDYPTAITTRVAFPVFAADYTPYPGKFSVDGTQTVGSNWRLPFKNENLCLNRRVLNLNILQRMDCTFRFKPDFTNVKWSSGSLPTGMQLYWSANEIYVRGTPTATGVSTANYQVTSGGKTYTLRIIIAVVNNQSVDKTYNYSFTSGNIYSAYVNPGNDYFSCKFISGDIPPYMIATLTTSGLYIRTKTYVNPSGNTVAWNVMAGEYKSIYEIVTMGGVRYRCTVNFTVNAKSTSASQNRTVNMVRGLEGIVKINDTRYFRIEVQSGSLPEGTRPTYSYDQGFCIFGKPTAAGSFTAVLRMYQFSGEVDNMRLTVNVTEPSATNCTVRLHDINGSAYSTVTVRGNSSYTLPGYNQTLPDGVRFTSWWYNYYEYRPGDKITVDAMTVDVYALCEDIPQISSVGVSGVVAPKHGSSPSYTASAPSGADYMVEDYNNEKIWKNGVCWYHAGNPMSFTDKFAEGEMYTVRVSLVPKSDIFEFATTGIRGTINTNTARVGVFTPSTAKKNIYVEYTFTCPKLTHISSVAVKVTEPKAGAKPDFTATKDNNLCDFYTGLGLIVTHGTGLEFVEKESSHTMEADETFESGKTYTAWVWLMITKDDYYIFDENLKVTINGHNAEITRLSDYWICATYDFTPGGTSSGYWIGDVNADGSVKNRDALILDRYIAGWKDYDKQIKNWDAADLNRDGQIKNRDALMLDRYIAGWKDYQKYVYKVNG